MKQSSFQEFTLIGVEDYCEVMVHITEAGKIVGLYCYADDIPTVSNEETGKEYKITVKPGNNPLFVQINRPASIYKLLITNGFIFGGMDEEDENYDNNVKMIENSLTYNDIGNIEALY